MLSSAQRKDWEQGKSDPALCGVSVNLPLDTYLRHGGIKTARIESNLMKTT